jgi:hypothetical protein
MTAERPSTKPRVDKLGVTPQSRIAILGVTEPGFRGELRAAGGRVVPGRAGARLSHVFLQADSHAALRRMGAAARMIASNGAVWLVTRGGSPRSPRPTHWPRAAARG